MNWDAIGAAGQMLGSIAVLITLGYLAVQIRHTREAMARSARQARADMNRELLILRIATPHHAETLQKARHLLGQPASSFVSEMMARGLSRMEAETISFDEWAWWYSREVTIDNIADLTQGNRVQFANAIRFVYGPGHPYGRAWYEANKPGLNPETVRYIDNLLAQPG